MERSWSEGSSSSLSLRHSSSRSEVGTRRPELVRAEGIVRVSQSTNNNQANIESFSFIRKIFQFIPRNG